MRAAADTDERERLIDALAILIPIPISIDIWSYSLCRVKVDDVSGGRIGDVTATRFLQPAALLGEILKCRPNAAKRGRRLVTIPYIRCVIVVQ